MNAPEIDGLTDLSLASEGTIFTIWKARQASLERDVEVRQFSPDLTKEQTDHHVRMARLIAKLNHGALTQIYDVNPEAKPPYVITEFTDAPSLSDIIEARGVFSDKEALLVASGVAEALAYAGTQIPLIIRNLKPQNIRLDSAGNLKITDYSLAIIAHDPQDGPSIDGDDLVGTPNFISPEHAEGSTDIDQRSDMYSLGMVLYYLVTRKVPFDVPDPFKAFELQKDGQLPSPREINQSISPSFVAFLSRLTMKAPQHRYESWADVLADLRRVLSGKAPTTRKLPPDARATIILKNTVVTGGAPSSPTPELDAVTGRKSKKRPHPILWLLLLIWLVWLANCRLMNPLHLPEKFAPQIAIPAIDAVVDKQVDNLKPKVEGQRTEAESQKPGWSAESDTATAPRQLQQIPPNPYARISASKAPSSGDPLEDRARPQPPPALEPVASRKPQVEDIGAPSAPTPKSTGSPALAAAIGDMIRKGDIAAAKAKCDALATPEALAVSSLLAQIPSPDEAVGTAILTKQGQAVTITYMGTRRTVTPVRLDGSSLIVKFTAPNGLTRDISMSPSKIDAGERIAFLNQWAETPQQHAAAAIAALQAGDEAAFRRHAVDSGALAAFLAQ